MLCWVRLSFLNGEQLLRSASDGPVADAAVQRGGTEMQLWDPGFTTRTHAIRWTGRRCLWMAQRLQAALLYSARGWTRWAVVRPLKSTGTIVNICKRARMA